MQEMNVLIVYFVRKLGWNRNWYLHSNLYAIL